MDDFEFVRLGDSAKPASRISVTTKLPSGDTVTVSSPEGAILLLIYGELHKIRDLLEAKAS